MGDNNNVSEDITLENIHPRYIGRLSEKEMDEIVDKSLRRFLRDDLVARIDLMDRTGLNEESLAKVDKLRTVCANITNEDFFKYIIDEKDSNKTRAYIDQKYLEITNKENTMVKFEELKNIKNFSDITIEEFEAASSKEINDMIFAESMRSSRLTSCKIIKDMLRKTKHKRFTVTKLGKMYIVFAAATDDEFIEHYMYASPADRDAWVNEMYAEIMDKEE